MASPWQIHVDTGGTFTDCLARDPDGGVHRAKVLSSSALRGRVLEWIDERRARVDAAWAAFDDCARGFAFRWLGDTASVPVAGVSTGGGASASILVLAAPPPPGGAGPFEIAAPEPAPILAARLVTRSPPGTPLPPAELRLATTRGTNALLERRGAPTALFITEGFRDLLEIGDQRRPDLFALAIEKPAPLPAAVVEVAERTDPHGASVRPPDLAAMRADARRLLDRGVRVAAVAFKHAYRNPAHEHAVAEALRAMGFETVACSADVAPLIKLLPRAETAVVEAYLAPVVTAYLSEIERSLTGRLVVMTSAGGLVPASRYGARESLLSGPAGGVVGAAAAGRASGFDRVIGFDMGGTSTDVARVAGGFAYAFETRVGGVRVMAPAIEIHTVAAGGGSICQCVEGRLAVGPQSAGAEPGPACYGAGGPLTLTDVNLLLGRLDPERFEIPVLEDRAREALEVVCAALRRHRGTGAGDADGGEADDGDAVLEGLLVIANERMADAIRQISVARGIDPAAHALVAFGGAGGQHACAVADRLGMDTIVFPADASLLSAVGLGAAAVERFAHAQVLAPLDDPALDLSARLAALERDARRQLVEDGLAPAAIRIERRLFELRLAGQDACLTIEAEDPGELPARFAERYRERYGHPHPVRPVELVSARVVAAAGVADDGDDGAPAAPREGGVPAPLPPAAAAPVARRRARFDGAWRQVPEHPRETLPAGAAVEGPAIVVEPRSVYVIEPGWCAEVDAAGALVARRTLAGGPGGTVARATRPAVVAAELFTNRLGALAREMGEMLQRTALSTNVKERLDFSCAILDAEGELLVHAPHMPVHLGSLGICVRAVRDRLKLGPGDVAITNHPGAGGSHLPDVTVVTPVFADDGSLIGHVASRAHHAEIGGVRPGSMPPEATRLVEEGVVLSPMLAQQGGRSMLDAVERRLRDAPYPSRAPDENIADVMAQMAANHRGARGLHELAREMGTSALRAAMDALSARAEQLTRSFLSALPDGTRTARQTLDDGTPIVVAATVMGDTLTVDFAGTGPVHPGNLNATPAIVASAVIYVLRLLLGAVHREVPLNEGMMRPVELRVPTSLLAPPFPDDPALAPAVVGGNVETSQRLVDTLLLALGDVACSQGTMNNVVFGTTAFGYYETVAGGSGAGPGHDGASAVQVHMTNTRITDPEILEHRYPVELLRFAVRRGSGGAGRHRGGDGVVREYRFLEPMSLSILAQHRVEGPYGRAGGLAGEPGRQRLVRADGTAQELPGCAARDVQSGERLILETPGGGGWGAWADVERTLPDRRS